MLRAPCEVVGEPSRGAAVRFLDALPFCEQRLLEGIDAAVELARKTVRERLGG